MSGGSFRGSPPLDFFYDSFQPQGASASQLASEISASLHRKQEQRLLQQLSELVSRGLLSVEVSEPVLVSEPSADGPRFAIRQSVQLKLSSQEYMERLELENKRLREQLEAIAEAVASHLPKPTNGPLRPKQGVTDEKTAL